jgi:hypothetical protein
MDEGFTEYITYLATNSNLQLKAYQKITATSYRYIGQNMDYFDSRDSNVLALTVYRGTSVLLEQIRVKYGTPKLLEFFHQIYNNYATQVMERADLLNIFENVYSLSDRVNLEFIVTNGYKVSYFA